MLAVSLKSDEFVVDVPRPQLSASTDAIVMVTTTVVGRWESTHSHGGPTTLTTPGAQFAGVVVETGADVSSVDIDDLVINTCTGFLSDGRRVRFGEGSLAGGHAEYVLVRQADEVLVKTTAAAEERAVFAGGEVALGIAAAERAMAIAGDGPIAVRGCDAAGLTAIAWIRHLRGRKAAVHAWDTNAASLAAAKALGAREIDDEALSRFEGPVIVPDFAKKPVPRRAPLVFTGVGPVKGAGRWPTLEDTRRAERAIRLREIDLTPLVSTVLPLDQAQEAYRIASDRPPGTRGVLLKP